MGREVYQPVPVIITDKDTEIVNDVSVNVSPAGKEILNGPQFALLIHKL